MCCALCHVHIHCCAFLFTKAACCVRSGAGRWAGESDAEREVCMHVRQRILTTLPWANSTICRLGTAPTDGFIGNACICGTCICGNWSRNPACAGCSSTK